MVCQVFCDRHFGGVNYPLGGVGLIPERMAEGFAEAGGTVLVSAVVARKVEGEEKEYEEE